MATPGLGCSVTFGTSTTLTLRIISWSGGGAECASYDATHMGSVGWEEMRPLPLKKAGELSLTCEWNPDSDREAIAAAVGVLQTITLNYSDGDSQSGSGWIQSYSPSAEIRDRMTVEIVIQWAGGIE